MPTMKFNFDNTYTTLPEELYSEVKAAKASNPQLVIYNNALAEELGIPSEDSAALTQLFSGKEIPEGAANIAQAYSGHQFGHFTNLGDGRTMLLGEQITPSAQRFDIQLKGSGQTPYSRRGDGKGTLSSMLREYLFSEAMHALNIPTTRSLAVVATGDAVYRETVQEGGILTRVASSHIRVGTFQYAQYFCSKETQEQLINYTIKRHYPVLTEKENPPLALLQAVMEKQIDLIVNWMRVGFIHGVMNTDNMLLSGETIDYGPCAFMNNYKPESVFSSIDVNGRYAYNQQAGIGLWNLTRFAETLLAHIDTNTDKAKEKALEVLNTFQDIFSEKHQKMLLAKLGLAETNEQNLKLSEDLLKLMEKHKADFTNTYIQLMYPEQKLNPCFENTDVKTWLDDWQKSSPSPGLMQQNNPVYILRNHLVEKALKEITQESKVELFNALLERVQNPYSNDTLDNAFIQPPLPEFDSGYKTFCGT